MAEEQSSHQLVRAPGSINGHVAVTISTLGETVLMLIDNSTTVAYIRSQGGTVLSFEPYSHSWVGLQSRPTDYRLVDPQTFNRTTECINGFSN